MGVGYNVFSIVNVLLDRREKGLDLPTLRPSNHPLAQRIPKDKKEIESGISQTID